MPLIVSPQHCILMMNDMTGEAIYVRSKLLAEETSLASYAKRRRQISYVHVLLDQHATLISNDVPSESFYPGEVALKMIGDQSCEALFSLFPRLRSQSAEEAYGPHAARVIGRHELQSLVQEQKLSPYNIYQRTVAPSLAPNMGMQTFT